MSGPSGVFQVLADLVARKTRVDASRVVPGARLIDFGLDSVKAMELVVELEQAFDLAIDDQELADMETLGDIAAYIERRLAAR
ncbi:MAG: acyl carrier protein [Planctomycetes bacterium]|nr:acyl carrier protein [Planctomycetota bacterium]MCW8139470.1 acyl carrier protein [Planctomycetota bacterium]